MFKGDCSRGSGGRGGCSGSESEFDSERQVDSESEVSTSEKEGRGGISSSSEISSGVGTDVGSPLAGGSAEELTTGASSVLGSEAQALTTVQRASKRLVRWIHLKVEIISAKDIQKTPSPLKVWESLRSQ